MNSTVKELKYLFDFGLSEHPLQELRVRDVFDLTKIDPKSFNLRRENVVDDAKRR
jgi:hypothetical protein